LILEIREYHGVSRLPSCRHEAQLVRRLLQRVCHVLPEVIARAFARAFARARDELFSLMPDAASR